MLWANCILRPQRFPSEEKHKTQKATHPRKWMIFWLLSRSATCRRRVDRLSLNKQDLTSHWLLTIPVNFHLPSVLITVWKTPSFHAFCKSNKRYCRIRWINILKACNFLGGRDDSSLTILSGWELWFDFTICATNFSCFTFSTNERDIFTEKIDRYFINLKEMYALTNLVPV